MKGERCHRGERRRGGMGTKGGEVVVTVRGDGKGVECCIIGVLGSERWWGRWV